ncbi:MAG: hypothetical protein JSV54_04590, partial [Chloroflexota bacterium]
GTANNGSFTATGSGTVEVTVTDANSCTSDNSTTVTANPGPTATASGTSTVCVGGTIQLVGGLDGMTAYSWTGPNGFNSTEQSTSRPNATINMTGDYTLTVTNDCGSDNATIYVSVITCGGGGGGGPGLPSAAPTCPLILTVNMLGKITKARMTSDGILCEDCFAFDPPKQNSWEAKAGTQLLLENNKPPELIKVTFAGSSPPAGDTETIGPFYEINAYASMNSLIPSAISISPLFSMSSAYNPNELPENTSEVTLSYYYDPSQGWLAMGPDTGAVAEIGKARGTLDYFVPATLLVKLAGTASAKFEASNLTISPSQTQINQEVIISVKVTNTGEASGDYNLELKVDGKVKSTKQITLAAGTSQTVNFTITTDAAGKHQIEVAGLEGEFVVVGPSGINWWLIAAIIILLLAILSFVGWRQLSNRK